MSRRSIIAETEKEIVKEAEIVMKWSKKRIVIATVLCLLLIAGGIYGLELLGRNATSVLGAKTENNHPQIKLPDQANVEQIIENAKKDLSNVNAKNIIQSQPQIQKVIDDLTHLTGSSSSARNLICDTLCK